MKRTLENMVNIFFDILYLVVEIFVPLRKYSMKNFRVWCSRVLKKNIKKAHKYFSTESYREFIDFLIYEGSAKSKKERVEDYNFFTESSLRRNVKNVGNLPTAGKKTP